MITKTVGEGSFQERCLPANTMHPFFIKQMSENKSNSPFRDKLIALFFFFQEAIHFMVLYLNLKFKNSCNTEPCYET